jgi:hypothetical protein
MLVIGAAVIAALVIRQGSTGEARLRLGIVAACAFCLRCLAVMVIWLIAIRTHGEGTWLNDEASFYLAAESLQPDPFLKTLPQGLDHLATDAYLGIITWMSVAIGHLDTVSYRLLNATLGSLVAIVASMVTARFVGFRPALIAGLALAVWPTLVLWSATFLRDTLASFVVVVMWWALISEGRTSMVRKACIVVVGLLLTAGLRPYLAGAVGLGVVAWAVYPYLARQSPRVVVPIGAAIVILGIGFGILQARRIDEAAHQLVYRQMTTRMETLGRLYSDPKPDEPPQEPPFGPGAAVAIPQPGTDWILAGLVQEPLGPGRVLVAYVDGSIRPERIADLWLLQSAPLSPAQILSSVGPGLVNFAAGTTPGETDSGSVVWVLDAIAWDVLLVLGVLGGIRARIPLRTWLFPMCVVLGTTAALVAVPGAAGNVDRHRASQTVPLLVVFASSWWLSRRKELDAGGLSPSSPAINASSALTPANSRRRSLR